jgi:hypothetical protein
MGRAEWDGRKRGGPKMGCPELDGPEPELDGPDSRPNGGSNIGSSVQLLDLERLQNPLLAAARLDTQG